MTGLPLSLHRSIIGLALLVATSTAGAQGLPLNDPTTAPGRPHEAYLAPVRQAITTTAPLPPPPELYDPPRNRPSPRAIWVNGYWDYPPDADRFEWIAGVWRVPPPGLSWVSGGWLRKGPAWQRVAGFWTRVPGSPYRPEPPPADRKETPKPRPSPDSIYVTGHYEPAPEGQELVWKPGFWTRPQPGWLWIPAAWLERPSGWAFQDGYWERIATVSNPPRAVSTRVVTLARLRDWQRRAAIGREANARAALVDAAAEVNATINNVLAQPTWPGASGITFPTGGDPSGSLLSGGYLRGGGPLPGSTGNSGQGQLAGGALVPANAYYVGNLGPGQAFASYSPTPTGVLGQSLYIGNSGPGQSYPSYSPTPTAVPGQSYYIGNSGPGQTYATYSTSGVSVGGYGYGATAPGMNLGGQVGGTGP